MLHMRYNARIRWWRQFRYLKHPMHVFIRVPGAYVKNCNVLAG